MPETYNLAEIAASEEALNAAAEDFANFCQEDWETRDKIECPIDPELDRQINECFIKMCKLCGHNTPENYKKFAEIGIDD